MTSYLDFDRLAAFDAGAFRRTRPYPWANPARLLTDEGYAALRRTLPEPSQFTESFGVARSHGQMPHDRLTLEYRDDLPVARPWHEFVAELRGPEYRRFIRRTFDRSRFRLNFHWHYTPNGCSVSPHCDARRKLGSHIFYLNNEEDWDPSWGGETLVLDDGGRFSHASAPKFDDFDAVISSDAMGNRSLLFARAGNSWHGVREIRCPPGKYRKVFIVVINDWLASVVRRTVGAMTGKRAEAHY
jgi:hypothetical protein